MSLFIKGRVAVTESGVIAESEITPDLDVVFIHPKMPYGVKQAVLGAAFKVDIKAGKPARGKRSQAQTAETANDIAYDVGAYATALLVGNVIGWQGPNFSATGAHYSDDGKAALLRTIDESAPLWQAVINEISTRNTTPDEVDEGTSGPKLAVINFGADDLPE